MSVRRRYNPVLDLEHGLRIPGKPAFIPKVYEAERAAIDWTPMIEAARSRMTDDLRFTVQWGDERRGGRPFQANQSAKAKVLYMDPRRDVVVMHPLIGRPETPTDVRAVAVYAGALHLYCRSVQKRPMQTPYGHEQTAEWYEAAMAAHPGGEFFADYLLRFFDWAAALPD